MSNRLIAFPYYGGKSIHLSWLLPRLPQTPCYVEPFGGSAAVLLNRDPSPNEVYNDLNGEVVNFFRVIRNQRDEFIHAVSNTPYSRSEFKESKEFLSQPEEVLTTEPVEWARCFITVIRQSYMANRRDWVASGIEAGRVKAWNSALRLVEEVVARMRNVQIENQDALTLITRFDHPDVLMYQDPPYVRSTRNERDVYLFEMTDEQHTALAEFNNKTKAKVALSGYPSKLYIELYEDNGWNLVRHDVVLGGFGDGDGDRTECLWCNYDPWSVRAVDQTAIDQFWNLGGRVNEGSD